MTIAQSDILLYIETHLQGVKTDLIGQSCVSVTDGSGSRTLGINIFGDILEVKPDGKKILIAESNLPHNLDELRLIARPTKWTEKQNVNS